MPQNKVKISHLQLAALLGMSTIFTLTFSFPGEFDVSMKRFINLAISNGIMFLLFIPFIIFSAKRDTGAIAQNNTVLKWLFGVIIIIRLLFTALLTAAQLELTVTRTIMHYLSPIVFTIIIFFTVFYGMNKGLQASARIAPILFILIIALIAFISLMMWEKISLNRIYSPLSQLGSDYGLLDSLIEANRNDEIFFFAVLCGFVRSKESDSEKKVHKGQGYKSVLVYLPIVLVTGLWLNFVYIAVLGRFADCVLCPMQMLSSLATLNIIERMDGIFMSTGIIMGLLKITLAFVCVRAIMSELLKSKKPNQPQGERPAKITALILLSGVAIMTFFFIKYENLINTEWYGSLAFDICLGVTTVVTAIVLPVAAILYKGKNAERNSNNNEKTIGDNPGD